MADKQHSVLDGYRLTRLHASAFNDQRTLVVLSLFLHVSQRAHSSKVLPLWEISICLFTILGINVLIKNIGLK